MIHFKKDVKARSKLDVSELSKGVVEMVGRHGARLKLAHNKENDLPQVWRGGKPRDWSQEFDLYRPVEGTGPVSLGWKKGELRVEAGGKVFQGTLTADGKYSFE